MITPREQTYIEEHAYLPEHIPTYVTSISQAEPFLVKDFLVYVKNSHLIFVGYPLREALNEKQMKKALDEAIRRFKPGEIALTAPSIPSSITGSPPSPSDHYYKLDLSRLSVSQKTRNMIKRAIKDLSLHKTKTFGEEHQKLVTEFLESHTVEEATQRIFKRIPAYVFSVPTALIFEARDRKGDLVAFDVAEFGPKYYALYMFNVRSKDHSLPGASDLLLSGVINQSITEQKRYINLGLGLHSGIAFFKTKWGGVPFLPYTSCLYAPHPEKRIEDLLQKL